MSGAFTLGHSYTPYYWTAASIGFLVQKSSKFETLRKKYTNISLTLKVWQSLPLFLILLRVLRVLSHFHSKIQNKSTRIKVRLKNEILNLLLSLRVFERGAGMHCMIGCMIGGMIDRMIDRMIPVHHATAQRCNSAKFEN